VNEFGKRRIQTQVDGVKKYAIIVNFPPYT